MSARDVNLPEHLDLIAAAPVPPTLIESALAA
jgi:hypothetical protein